MGLALRAISITIRHCPDSKDGVPPLIVQAALEQNASMQNRIPTHFAILLMYVGFLRQSNVLPPTKAAFDASRHLTWGDITITPQGLQVRIKWSKTIQRAADAKTILLPNTVNALLSPVTVFKALQEMHPNPPAPQAPLLTFKDGNPITIRYMARRWALLIQLAGHSPQEYSLHSLRRGGAGFAYNVGGADINDVMTQGTWRSMAVRAYIKPKDGKVNSVHRALARL